MHAQLFHLSFGLVFAQSAEKYNGCTATLLILNFWDRACSSAF